MIKLFVSSMKDPRRAVGSWGDHRFGLDTLVERSDRDGRW